MSGPRKVIVITPPPLPRDGLEAAIACVRRRCKRPDDILQALGLTP